MQIRAFEQKASIILPDSLAKLKKQCQKFFKMNDEEMKTLEVYYWDPSQGKPKSEEDSSELIIIDKEPNYTIFLSEDNLGNSFIKLKYKKDESKTLKKQVTFTPGCQDTSMMIESLNNSKIELDQLKTTSDIKPSSKNDSKNNAKIEPIDNKEPLNEIPQNIQEDTKNISNIDIVQPSPLSIKEPWIDLKKELLEFEERSNKKMEESRDEIIKVVKELIQSQQGLNETQKEGNLSQAEMIKTQKEATASQQTINDSIRDVIKSQQEMTNIFNEVVKSQQAMVNIFNDAVKSQQRMVDSFNEAVKLQKEMVDSFNEAIKPQLEFMNNFKESITTMQPVVKHEIANPVSNTSIQDSEPEKDQNKGKETGQDKGNENDQDQDKETDNVSYVIPKNKTENEANKNKKPTDDTLSKNPIYYSQHFVDNIDDQNNGSMKLKTQSDLQQAEIESNVKPIESKVKPIENGNKDNNVNHDDDSERINKINSYDNKNRSQGEIDINKPINNNDDADSGEDNNLSRHDNINQKNSEVKKEEENSEPKIVDTNNYVDLLAQFVELFGDAILNGKSDEKIILILKQANGDFEKAFDLLSN